MIGPNNAGKTAILEAIRIALTRRWGQRGTGFHRIRRACLRRGAARKDPKAGDPVTIEVEMHEFAANDWPEDLHEILANIIQLNPLSGQASINNARELRMG